MRYKFEFNDWDLQELDSILIQPKKDGNGYTVHKTMKPEPGDGWDEWKSSLAASFEKAQENKTVIEELQSSLNKAQENKKTDEEYQKEVAGIRSELLYTKDARDHWQKQYLQTCKKVEDIQAELDDKNNQIEKLQNSCNCLAEQLEEYKESNQEWQDKYSKLHNKKEESKPVFTGYSFSTELTFTATIVPAIDNGDAYEKFKAEFPELEITEVDFSDHQTLNNVFKKCFSIKRDRNPKNQEEFTKFIDAFERGATVYKTLGYFDLHWLMLFLIGESPTWLSDNHKELERYQWNKEHPFKYSINTIFDPETRVTEYYVVFNSAPEYRD